MNRFHRYYCASPGWARLVQTTLVPAVLEGTELDRRVLELGPGPGLTTEVLAGVAPELTAIDADATFSAVVCLTMLHHLPDPELQDRLFAEVLRVLGPGGVSAAPTSRVGASGSASSTWATTRPSSTRPRSGHDCTPQGSSRPRSAPDRGSYSMPTDLANGLDRSLLMPD